jgi:hypothetical protein
VSAAGEVVPGFRLPRRPLLAVCLLTIVVADALAVLSLDSTTSPWPALTAAAIYTAVGALLARSTAVPVPLGLTATAAVTPTALVLIAGWTATGAGYSMWYLGMSVMMMMLLALRRRLAAAWIGALTMSVAAIIVAEFTGFGATAGLEVVLRQLALLAVGTLFALGIRRTQRQIVALAREGATRAAEEAAGAAADAERRERLSWAHLLSTRLLETLASGRPITPALRLDAALTEAELRDGLRAPLLAREPVASAARAARARGVEVVLLDDRGVDLPPDDHARVLAMVARELAATPSGRFVARLLPADRAQMLTIVADEPVDRRRQYPEADADATGAGDARAAGSQSAGAASAGGAVGAAAAGGASADGAPADAAAEL